MPMRQKQPSNLVALLLSLIPGAGHVYLDHAVRGAVVFAVWATCLNGVFLGSILKATEYTQAIRDISLAGLILIWIGSVWHIYKQSYGTDRRSLAQHRELLLRSALEDYLRDELPDSVRKLEQAISLDVDWQDPDPLFHLGVVMLRLAERYVDVGETERARTARRRSQWAFRTCLTRDSAEKWRAEIARESKRMRHLLRVTGRPRVTPTGKLPDVFDETGEFPELRSSGRLPRAQLLAGLREAVEDTAQPRGSGSIPGAGAELPRTRRTSRPFSSAELSRRLATDRRDRPQKLAGPPPTRVTARLKPVQRTPEPSASSSEERPEDFAPGVPATRKSTRPHDSESLRRAVESGEIQGSATRKRLMEEPRTGAPLSEDPPRRRLSSERLTRRYRPIRETDEATSPEQEAGGSDPEPLPSPQPDPRPSPPDQEGRGSRAGVDNGEVPAAVSTAPSASETDEGPGAPGSRDPAEADTDQAGAERTEDIAGSTGGAEVTADAATEAVEPAKPEPATSADAVEDGHRNGSGDESGDARSEAEREGSEPAKARAGRGASS